MEGAIRRLPSEIQAKRTQTMSKLLTIPAAEYHAASRRGEYVSSHLLADFRESPELYRRKVSGEIEDADTPSLALGRATHCLVLEGRDAFDEQYVVADGPVNPRTGEPFGKATKAYADWQASQTKEVVGTKDFGFIVKLQKSVWLHDAASALLNEGQAEGVVRADCCGVLCQSRLDWLSNEYGIVDLKTCDSLKWFENDCRRYGYIYQMAFYRAVMREATGETVPVRLIAVEKNEPFSTGVWELTDDVLEQAELVNEAALRRLRECRLKNEWPTGYEAIRILDTL